MPIRSMLAAALALCFAATPALAADPDISKVNGSISVEAGQQYDELSTVNGSIRVGAGARIGEAQTVNGSIHLAAGVQADALTAVNGSIRTSGQVQVRDGISNVNGGIFLDRGSKIGTDVETVNGAIGLVDTEVGGGIQSVNGDLTVGIGSHVRGGIRYEKPGRVLFSLNKRLPRVIIGPNARVDGPLVFERKVTLYVHRSATIGPVSGATAVPYSGDRAPQP